MVDVLPWGGMGGGYGCINQVGDLCPIVMHLYLYLYESIKYINDKACKKHKC